MEYLDGFRELRRYRHIPHCIAVERGGEWGYQNMGLKAERFALLWKRFRQNPAQTPAGLLVFHERVDDLHFYLLVARRHLAADHALPSIFRQEAKMIALRGIGRIDAASSLFHKKSFLSQLERRLAELPAEEPSLTDEAVPRLSLILFDIDHFKRFNDVHGHLTGDRVILAVAGVLRRFARECDGFAARYGGEEFALILPGRDETEALRLAEELRGRVQSLTLTDTAGHSIPGVTVSLGVSARCHRAGLSAAEAVSSLIEEADLALYACKDLGRNRSFPFHRFREDRGRIIESIGAGLALINLGQRHGVGPGCLFRVIDRRFNGETALTDPESGRRLAPAPMIVKGQVEVLPPGYFCHDGIDPALSLVRFQPLRKGFELQAGDRLLLAEPPVFSPAETVEFGVSLTGGPFVPVETAMNMALERGLTPVFVDLPDWRQRKLRLGRERAVEELQQIGAELAGAGRSVLPLATDRAVVLIPPTDESRTSLDAVLSRHGLQALESGTEEIPDTGALKLIRRLLDFHLPQLPRTVMDDSLLLSFARHFQKTGEVDSCAAVLDRLSLGAANSSESANLRCFIALSRERFDEAERICHSALAADPTRPEHFANLGLVLLRRQRPDEAVEVLRQARKLRPADAQTSNNLAEALLQSGGDPDEAAMLADEALRAAGSTSQKRTAAETLLTATTLADGEAGLRQTIRNIDDGSLDPAGLCHRAAAALIRLGHPAAAELCGRLADETGRALHPAILPETI